MMLVGNVYQVKSYASLDRGIVKLFKQAVIQNAACEGLILSSSDLQQMFRACTTGAHDSLRSSHPAHVEYDRLYLNCTTTPSHCRPAVSRWLYRVKYLHWHLWVTARHGLDSTRVLLLLAAVPAVCSPHVVNVFSLGYRVLTQTSATPLFMA